MQMKWVGYSCMMRRNSVNRWLSSWRTSVEFVKYKQLHSIVNIYNQILIIPIKSVHATRNERIIRELSLLSWSHLFCNWKMLHIFWESSRICLCIWIARTRHRNVHLFYKTFSNENKKLINHHLKFIIKL